MIIMEGTVVKGDVQIGEDSLVLENTVVPDGWMVYGNSAKPIRTLTLMKLKAIYAVALSI